MIMFNKIFKQNIKDYKAKDLMIKHVITLSPQENLWKAQNMMSRYNIKKIVIVKEGKKHPIGIMSLKDIIKFVISDKTYRDLHEIPISEAMIKNLIMANKNSAIADCAKTMTENNVSSLIIVNEDDDDNNSLAGIVTTTDFANFFSDSCIGLTSVENYMSQPVFSISIKEKVSTAAQIMLEKKVSRLVVIDEDDNQNKSVGIISETDLSRTVPAFKSRTVRSVYEHVGLLFTSKSKPNFIIEPSFVCIEDIMTPNAVPIDKHADLAEAAKIMIRRHVSGLPVIGSIDSYPIADQQPIGITSKSDIVKALTDLA
jgi:CBS domain-containing protein